MVMSQKFVLYCLGILKKVVVVILYIVCSIILICLFGLIFVTLLNDGPILLQGGDESPTNSWALQSSSRNSSPRGSPRNELVLYNPNPLHGISNSNNFGSNGLVSTNNNSVTTPNNNSVTTNNNSVTVTTHSSSSAVIHNNINNPWIAHGLFLEPIVDTAEYSVCNSSNTYNTQYHATKVFEQVNSIRTLLTDTGINIEISSFGPLSEVNSSTDLVSSFRGAVIVIKSASTVGLDIQEAILADVKQLLHHLQHGSFFAEEAEKDFDDGIYDEMSTYTEKSFTNSEGEREQPNTDIRDLDDALEALEEAKRILIRNSWRD